MNFFKLLSLLYLILIFNSCQNNPPTSQCRNISTPNVSCPPTFSTFLDPRDSFLYQTVTICNQTWFAENARYDTPDSILQQHPSMNPDYSMYGVDTLSAGVRYYNAVSMQYACPNGWHVPTDREWSNLEINLGMNPLDTVDFPNSSTPNQGEWFRACGIPDLLMATTGWNNRGTNASGFNIIGPNNATFWTSSTWGETGGDLKDIAYVVRQFFANTDYIRKYAYVPPSRFNCRCIEN